MTALVILDVKMNQYYKKLDMSSKLFSMILNKDGMLSATYNEVYLKHLGKGGVDSSNLSIVNE